MVASSVAVHGSRLWISDDCATRTVPPSAIVLALAEGAPVAGVWGVEAQAAKRSARPASQTRGASRSPARADPAHRAGRRRSGTDTAPSGRSSLRAGRSAIGHTPTHP